jgi:phosphoribosylamine---glycine ligase
MKVLIVGNGGRENALACKIAESPLLTKLFVAPGNAGTEKIAENITFNYYSADRVKELLKLAKINDIDLTIVSSEELLAQGIVDIFQRYGMNIFGPTAKAAKIEWSKSHGKDLMNEACIASAPHKVFWQQKDAVKHIMIYGAPIVIKANGLAKGKGVYVCWTIKQAEDAIDLIMVKKAYGDAGKCVIVEKFLEGEEISIHALCDGLDSIICPPAKDYKLFNGKNTGGMGAYAPAEMIGGLTLDKIKSGIVGPILRHMNIRNPFSGLMYPGLMITNEGPMTLELNARFGDPEAQVYMSLLKSDLLEILLACAEGRLSEIKIEWHDGYAVCVALVSEGYPGKYKTGFQIKNVKKVNGLERVKVFHAGTTRENGKLVTTGGRVLNVVATGGTLEEARSRVYEAVDEIYFEGMCFRDDIGLVPSYQGT